jgi:hypothetical protein
MKNSANSIGKRIILLSLLALILMLSYGILARAQATTQLHFSQATYWLHPDDTTTLTLIIADASDLGGWETALNFDARLLAISSASGGNFLASTGRTAQFMNFTDENLPGSMALGGYSRDSTTGVAGTGELARLQVQAQAPGEDLLELTSPRLAHPDGQLIDPQTITTQTSRVAIGYALSAHINDAGSNQVMLEWLQPSSDASFNVWRSSAPYFYPEDSGSNDITLSCMNNSGTITCLNSDALGNPAINYFYLVRTLDADGNLRSYSHLAEFDFVLESD